MSLLGFPSAAVVLLLLLLLHLWVLPLLSYQWMTPLSHGSFLFPSLLCLLGWLFLQCESRSSHGVLPLIILYIHTQPKRTI